MSQRQSTKKQIVNLSVSAMLCALGVIILSLGSLVEVVDASVAVIASLLCVYAVIEIGGIYPWLIWLVTSVVSLLLLVSQPTPVVFYALLAGYYPILKARIERLPVALSWLLKWVCATVGTLAVYAVSYLFVPTLLDGLHTPWLLALAYLGILVVFLLYDVCLTMLITFYFRRLRKRLRLHKE